MTRMIRSVLGVWLILLGLTSAAAAQTLTGAVAGVLKDDQGAVLPGVTVTLTGVRGSHEQVSDAEGRYRFLALEPGTYELSAALAGFETTKQSGIVITAGRNLEIEMALKIAARTESITVLGEVADRRRQEQRHRDHPLAGPAVQRADHPDRDQRPELRAGHQQQLGVRRRKRIGQRPADRRRRHARSLRRHRLDASTTTTSSRNISSRDSAPRPNTAGSPERW